MWKKTAKKSTCARTQTNFYNPNEEDEKMKAFKAEGKQIQQDNKDTKDRICKSIIICDSQMKSNTTFGRCTDIFRHCTVTK